MKRLTLILITCILSLELAAQENQTTPKTGRPDVKGDLFLDFGFNTLNNRPEQLNTRFFPSRVANIYYQYPVHLGENSGITFNPGIGLGMDKMAFKSDSMLVNN